MLASVGLTRVSSEVTTNFELNAKELAIDVLKELEHTIHDNEFITNVSMQSVVRYLPVHCAKRMRCSKIFMICHLSTNQFQIG